VVLFLFTVFLNTIILPPLSPTERYYPELSKDIALKTSFSETFDLYFYPNPLT